MQPKEIDTLRPSQPTDIALAPRIWRVLTLGDRLNRRVSVVLWSASVIAIGLLLSWGWLVAAGLSSIVLAILPCAAMCAAGLCMAGSHSKQTDTGAKVGTERDQA